MTTPDIPAALRAMVERAEKHPIGTWDFAFQACESYRADFPRVARALLAVWPTLTEDQLQLITEELGNP